MADEPVFHEYEVPPVGVNTAASPGQIVAEFTVTVMEPPIVTVATAVPVQLPVVPVTVYDVVVVGETLNGLAEEPVFHT